MPYSGENKVGGLNKTKLVLSGVDTGFIMEMLVCPRKSLQCNKLSDSGTLYLKGKNDLSSSDLGELGRNDFSSPFTFTLSSSCN